MQDTGELQVPLLHSNISAVKLGGGVYGDVYVIVETSELLAFSQLVVQPNITSNEPSGGGIHPHAQSGSSSCEHQAEGIGAGVGGEYVGVGGGSVGVCAGDGGRFGEVAAGTTRLRLTAMHFGFPEAPDN